jgi:hypothetical protein
VTSFDWFIVALALLAISFSSQSRKQEQEGRSPGFLGFALWALLIIPPSLAVPLLFISPLGGVLLLGAWLAVLIVLLVVGATARVLHDWWSSKFRRV